MIVIDASLMTAALIEQHDLGRRARDLLSDDPDWHAPDHLFAEVTSAIQGRLLGGKVGLERADIAVRTLGRLKISCAPWPMIGERVWELRDNLTAYDAAYIALAEIRGCRVVTTDRKLEGCPTRRCPIEVID